MSEAVFACYSSPGRTKSGSHFPVAVYPFIQRHTAFGQCGADIFYLVVFCCSESHASFLIFQALLTSYSVPCSFDQAAKNSAFCIAVKPNLFMDFSFDWLTSEAVFAIDSSPSLFVLKAHITFAADPIINYATFSPSDVGYLMCFFRNSVVYRQCDTKYFHSLNIFHVW